MMQGRHRASHRENQGEADESPVQELAKSTQKYFLMFEMRYLKRLRAVALRRAY
jgi:hypothetical protein